jgi:hypothetical protein
MKTIFQYDVNGVVFGCVTSENPPAPNNSFEFDRDVVGEVFEKSTGKVFKPKEEGGVLKADKIKEIKQVKDV